MTQETVYDLPDLLRVMQRLRDPQTGCPWDIEQTFQSIVPSTLEECYELAAAIEQQDFAHVAEELGDVLFQVIFYSQLGAEQDLFDFEGVVNTLVQKLVRRHPHVFEGGRIEGVAAEAKSIDAVMQTWESIKAMEREEKSLQGTLADVPMALPALPRAQKLQSRAARAGFDWSGAIPVMAKVEEELAELNAAVQADDVDGIEDELGDLMFSCVNLARHLGVDAESSLRRASAKFEHRFTAMEVLAKAQNSSLELLDSLDQDALWNEVKSTEKGEI